MAYKGVIYNIGDTIEDIPAGAELMARCIIEETNGVSAKAGFRADNAKNDENLCWGEKSISEKGSEDFLYFFKMPNEDVDVRFQACHSTGGTHCIHDELCCIHLKVQTVKPSFEVTVTTVNPETCLWCHHKALFGIAHEPVCWRRITTEGQVETFTADDGLVLGDEYEFTCGIASETTEDCMPDLPLSGKWETFEGKKTINIDCRELYHDPICRYFGISREECKFWIASWILDPVFLAEEIRIVTEGKNLAGELVTATKLDYAFIAVAIAGIATPGFSEGMVLKQFKELVRIAKGSDEFATLVKTEKVANFLASTSYDKIKKFTELVKADKFDDAIKLADNIPEITTKNAKWVLKRYDKWFDLLAKELGAGEAATVFKTQLITSKLKNVIKKIPGSFKKNTFVKILVIWFLVDNLPFYIYIYLKFTGQGPGDVSYRGAQWVDTLTGDSIAIRDAIKLEAWDVARTHIALYEKHLTEFKIFLATNKETLDRGLTYDVLYAAYETHNAILEAAKIQVGMITWAEEFTATVRHARDGDSFEIEYEMAGESRRIDVRIVGINTPEMTSTKGDIKCTTSPITKVPKEYADRAKETIFALEDDVVTIQLDLSHIYDTYNRLLARVLSGGSDVGLEQLEKGLACYYFRETHKWVDDAEYKAAEADAKVTHTGIWSLPPPDVGKIGCKSTPSNAVIYVDGEETPYRTTRTLDDIAVGEHTLMFKGSTKCDECFCETLRTVIKDDTIDAYCKLCAIYEIHQPYYCKDRLCAEGIIKQKFDPYIFIDGKKTGERAGHHTIIRFGRDIDDNPLTFGTRECDFGSHTIELKYTTHKTVKATEKIDPGDFFSITPEMPEGKEEEEVKPTPTPSPGEDVEPVVEGTGALEIQEAIDADTKVVLSQYGIKIYLDGCDCRHRPYEKTVFGSGKFCDDKKNCPAELGSHTIKVTKKNYANWEYTFTIKAGDELTVIPELKSMAAISGVSIIEESKIPDEIYLERDAVFKIKVQNTCDISAEFSTRIQFEGVDTTKVFPFESGISAAVPPGKKVDLLVPVYLPDAAIPADMTEAIYDIGIVVVAYV